jgi:fido (protein-threonine AMPylation protein)
MGRDCRPSHLELFEGLTPDGFDYFAGHYRGEQIRCLRQYRVKVASDPRVGASPDVVLPQIVEFRKSFFRALASLDGGNALPDAQFPRAHKIYLTAAVAAWALCEFFTIHPYANGNGHIGRFFVWAILGRYGYWPKSWPLDNRPPEPSYSNALMAYRNGQFDELEKFILSRL